MQLRKPARIGNGFYLVLIFKTKFYDKKLLFFCKYFFFFSNHSNNRFGINQYNQMAITLDSIDVYFVGNPSKGFSSYPGGFEKITTIPYNLEKPYVGFEDKSTCHYIYYDYKSVERGYKIKQGRSFGILLKLKGYKIKKDKRGEVLLFLKNFLKKEVIEKTNIFTRHDQKLYEIKEFSEIEKKLEEIINEFKIIFLEKFGDYLKPNKENKVLINQNRVDVSERDFNSYTKNDFILVSIVVMIAIVLPFSVNKICKYFNSSSLILLFFQILSILFISLLLLTGLIIFLKKKNYQDNRISCVIFFVGIIIAFLGFHREILNNSKSIAHSIVYSLTPNEIIFKSKKDKTSVLLCIDKSASSNDKIKDYGLIPKWFEDVKKNKEIFLKLGIHYSEYRHLIDSRITEFDLMKIKALKVVYENHENLKIFTFGDKTEHITTKKDSTGQKFTKRELARMIINLDNRANYTDFEDLFIELTKEVNNNDLDISKNYNVIILSDFVKEKKTDHDNFSINKSLKKSFYPLTRKNIEIVFNFLFFKTNKANEGKDHHHTDSHKTNNKCMFCFIKENLNSKGKYFKKVERIDLQYKVSDFLIEDKLFFYYHPFLEEQSSAFFSYENENTDKTSFYFHATTNNINERGSFRYKYVDGINNWIYFHASEDDPLKMKANEKIEVQYENKFSSKIDKNNLYMYIEDKENKIVHKLEIIFQRKLDFSIAVILVILLIILLAIMSNNIRHNFFLLIKDFKKSS